MTAYVRVLTVRGSSGWSVAWTLRACGPEPHVVGGPVSSIRSGPSCHHERLPGAATDIPGALGGLGLGVHRGEPHSGPRGAANF